MDRLTRMGGSSSFPRAPVHHSVYIPLRVVSRPARTTPGVFLHRCATVRPICCSEPGIVLSASASTAARLEAHDARAIPRGGEVKLVHPRQRRARVEHRV